MFIREDELNQFLNSRKLMVVRYENSSPIVILGHSSLVTISNFTRKATKEGIKEIKTGDYALNQYTKNNAVCREARKLFSHNKPYNPNEVYRITCKKGGFHLKKSRRKILSIPRIFVKNDAIAFFKVDKPEKTPINIEDIVNLPFSEGYGEFYNFSVRDKETEYFNTEHYTKNIETISVTTPCIVFCAFTLRDDGSIKSSGVYHAESQSYNDISCKEFFKKRLYLLVDTVRSNPKEEVMIKGSGGHVYCTRYCSVETTLDYLAEILEGKRIKLKKENFLLEGGYCRHTLFKPKTGEMITYLPCGKDKMIL